MSIKDVIRGLPSPDEVNSLLVLWKSDSGTETQFLNAVDLKALADNHDDLIRAADRLIVVHRNTVDSAARLGAEMALSKAIEEAEKL